MDTPQQTSVLDRIQSIARLSRKHLGELLADWQVHAGQERLILALAEQNGQSPSALAAILGIQPPTITKSIRRLETAGYLRRSLSATDGRSVIIHLTPKGQRIVREIVEALAIVETRALAAVNSTDHDVLVRGLRSMEESLTNPHNTP